ncbi:hypothetical protein ABZ093_19250 [Streptomyces cyaneofuscatus]|uniref:hypothetical protein n=1 Tax=Streptomyces cyaneofuscatus TaxID=66883 RepID=UPI0033B97F38
MRHANKAERRASRRGVSLAEYEQMAMQSHRHVAESLIARHNRRMGNMQRVPDGAIEPVMSALLSFGFVDVALRGLGATRDRHPASYGGSWVDHLGWGADSAFIAARLLFSGQYTGAAAVLRSQFERWTENAAYNAGVRHEKGESAASFAARSWSACHRGYPSALRAREESDVQYGPDVADLDFWEDQRSSVAFQGSGVTIGKDYVVYPAAMMDSMSELLHGRGSFVDVTRWEASQLLENEPLVLTEVAQWLSDVLMLNLRQIRLCLATLAEEQEKPQIARGLFSLPERTYAGDVGPVFSSLFPLLPRTGLASDPMDQMRGAEYAYHQVMQGRRPAGRLYRDNEMTHLYFYERRARAGRWAMKALESEKEKLGDKFNLDGLSGRNTMYIMAAEMAGVLAAWLGATAQGNAAATCSSALRSAYWLWLEDDDRAMSVLRVVLEQCARLRVWSIKPEKAEKLENSSATTPKDWINASGLRRLQSLNRALGEFSHFHAKIRLDGARDILQKMQKNGEHEDSQYTARGHALDALAALLMSESIRSVYVLSPVVAKAFEEISEEVFQGDGGLQQSLEDLLQRSLLLKNAPLGEYSLRGPAEEERRSKEN